MESKAHKVSINSTQNIIIILEGEVPEWSNGAVSKIAVGPWGPPGVRIPPSP